jgi:hypothetical protein
MNPSSQHQAGFSDAFILQDDDDDYDDARPTTPRHGRLMKTSRCCCLSLETAWTRLGQLPNEWKASYSSCSGENVYRQQQRSAQEENVSACGGTLHLQTASFPGPSKWQTNKDNKTRKVDGTWRIAHHFEPALAFSSSLLPPTSYGEDEPQGKTRKGFSPRCSQQFRSRRMQPSTVILTTLGRELCIETTRTFP